MAVIELITLIHAPVERVFDLSRSIDLHVDSTAPSGECATAGVTSGLIGLDQEVTWRARHLGMVQNLTTRITAFERPHHFRDSMVSGAFRRFDHDHYFEQIDGLEGVQTRMRDVFDFAAPLELLGTIAERLFLTRYMRAFLLERNRVIQAAAEGAGWQRYLPTHY